MMGQNISLIVSKTATKLVFIACFLSGALGVAGTRDGGGGKGVLCGNQVSTLDLFEARHSGLIPIERSNDLNENLKLFGMELAKHFTDSASDLQNPDYPELILKEMQQSIIEKFNDIPKGTRLQPTSDATMPNIPVECSFVQIAVYDDQAQKIFLDREYWDQMSVLDQSALILHEWIYRRARLSGSVTSDETRKVIGQIFSGYNPEPLLSPIWNANKKIWCGAGIEGTDQEVFEFFGVDETRNGKSGTALYFRVFKGITLTSRISAFIPNLSLDQFFNREYLYLTTFAQQASTSKEWEIEMEPNKTLDVFMMRAYEVGSVKNPYSNGFCEWQ